MNSSDLKTDLRELTVQLMRGNAAQAEVLLDRVATSLKETLDSKDDPQGAPMQRAQQTMFAIHEARLMLEEGDYPSAAAAARDAGREWNNPKFAATAAD